MKNKNFSYYYSRFGVFAVLLVSMVAASLLRRTFLTERNLINVLRQNAMITIIACGTQMVLICGEVDLSAGSVTAFCGCIAAMVTARTNMPILAILVGVSIGLVLGFINGFITTQFRVPSFIATLAMQQVARGTIYVLTKAKPIPQLGNFTWIGQGYIGKIPVPVILLLIVLLLSWMLLNKMPLGRYFYAVGGNMIAAKASGINVKRVKTGAFMIQGLLAGFGGVILMARINSGQPSAAIGYEFDAITAVIIGGTSLSGGVGNIYGTIAGAFFVAVLNNIMTLMNVGSYYQQIVQGLIILIAVIIDVQIRDSEKS